MQIINAGHQLTAEEFAGMKGTDAYVRMLGHRLRVRVDAIDQVETNTKVARIERVVDQSVTSMFHSTVDHLTNAITLYFSSRTDLDMARYALQREFKDALSSPVPVE